jgi:uncharacterized protein involved in exopolysaccharide biosynthesis
MLVRSREHYDSVATERDAEGEFIGLPEIAAFLRRYLPSILAFALLGLLGAAFHVVTTDRVYSAGTQILIEPKMPQLLQQPGALSTSLDTAQVESQITVMRSEKIAQMVIDELSLIQNPDFFSLGYLTMAERLRRFALFAVGAVGVDPADVSWLSGRMEEAADGTAPVGSQLTEFEQRRVAIGIFSSNIDIRRIGVSYAVAITYRSRNAELAAEIANATARNFLLEQIETKAAAARQGGEWLEMRMGEMRAKMNTAMQIAQEFRARHDYRVKPPGASVENGLVVYDETGGSSQGEPTLEELEVTADTYRQMYGSFLRAYMDNLSQQSYVVADARAISEATRPLAPSHPRKKLILVFGLVAGLMVGVGTALLRNSLDSTIRSPRQLRDQLGLPCLCQLPARRGTRGGFGALDEVATSQYSPFSKALKRAKFEIRLAGAPNPIRSIGVTSAAPHEGKSVVASNLALLYAISGQRTLLIDADTDYSDLSSRLLNGRHGPVDDRGIVVAALGDVDLLPVYTIGGRDASSMPDLRGYDMAVVNLPPLASGPESLAMSAQLCGVLCVAEWGSTTVAAAGQLVSVIQGHGTPILGALLTRARFLTRERRYARA